MTNTPSQPPTTPPNPVQTSSSRKRPSESAQASGSSQHQCIYTETSAPTEKAPPAAGVAAGITKAFATRTLVLYNALAQSLKGSISATTKGALKYYTRAPVRFFRPVKVDHWWVVKAMRNDKTSRLEYSKLVSREGIPIITKHMLPLLLANSLGGMLLFTTFESTNHALQARVSSRAAPFGAGFVGGAVQTLVSTPIETLATHLSSSTVAQRTNESLVKHAYALLSSIPASHRLGVLYRGLTYNALKDGVGFAVFFGAFEHTKERAPVSAHWASPYARGVDTLVAGACAGIAFQTLTYPLDVLRPLLFPVCKVPTHASPTGCWAARIPGLLTTHGLAYVYSGMSAQLAKAVPVSAVALFVYEWAKLNVWDED